MPQPVSPLLFNPACRRLEVGRCLHSLQRAAVRAGFRFQAVGRSGPYPLWLATRLGVTGAPWVYLSAGLHGDEPAGPLALLELFRCKAFPSGLNYIVYPMLCPRNLAVGQRAFRGGLDPNRDYDQLRCFEVRAQVQSMRFVAQNIGMAGNRDFLDATFCLHEDWEARGFYLYELNLGSKHKLAPAMLAAAATACPLQPTGRIDGHDVRGGRILYRRLPQVLDGCPEALYLSHSYTRLSYTLESPSSRPLAVRVAALTRALHAGLASLVA